jgi:4'-phosphopantetheinyl transferase
MLLRVLLGRYLGVEPSRVELETEPHGKPRLVLDAGLEPGRTRVAQPLAADLGFSLSHCRGTALLAIARRRRVGVDLELPRALPRVSSLARRAFGAERARELEDLPLPQREVAFLRLWTRHEAELKCAGTGLAAGRNRDRALWTLELPTGGRGAATLALDAVPASLSLWSSGPEPAEPGSEDADCDRLRERRAFVDGGQDDVGAVMLA